MAKKIELLHTTYDESGNVESQEVVHPLTSPDCIIMENGKTLDEVMGDGIATPTLTHEGTSFKVGVGDSNIEVVDGDVAGMTLKGQSYQNILPKPTTLIMETDEKEFKINDKIDSNIIIDDNIAEIATVKGKTIVNTVQEESGSEYTVLGEDLSGQSIVTTNKPEGNIKGVTLQGQTLVNTIQEPCEDEYVVLGAEDGIEISAETGGHGTIEDTVGGSIKSAILKGNTLVNYLQYSGHNSNFTKNGGMFTLVDSTINTTISENTIGVKDNTLYTVIVEVHKNTITGTVRVLRNSVFGGGDIYIPTGFVGTFKKTFATNLTKATDLGGSNTIQYISSGASSEELIIGNHMVVEGDCTNEDIPYFEGMSSVKLPVLKTTGKNLLDTTSMWFNGYASNSSVIKQSNLTKSLIVKVKPNTTYTFTRTQLTNRCVVSSFKGNHEDLPITKELFNDGGFTQNITQFTTLDDTEYVIIYVHHEPTTPNGWVEHGIYQLEEGSQSTSYEPYQSSTVTTSKIQLTEAMFEQGSVDEKRAVGTLYADMKNTSESDYYTTRIRTVGTYKVKPNTDYQLKLNSNYRSFIAYFNDGKYMSHITWNTQGTRTFTVPSNCNEVALVFCFVNGVSIPVSEFLNMGVELEETLTLRGIGDIKDELNLLTGKVTQQIGEIVLNGSEYWAYSGDHVSNEEYVVYNTRITTPINSLNIGIADKLHCDKEAVSQTVFSKECVYLNSAFQMCYVRIKRERGDIVNYLNSNPITIQYQLAQESVKTIDLTVTDQDGNTIPHIQTQPTVTHITASSNYLIPTVTIDNNLAYDTIIKPSTLYTVRFKHDTVNADNPLTVDLGGTVQTVTSTEFTITTPDTLTHNQLVFSGKNNVVSEVQVIEGDVTSIEYPFFEGMNDVKFSDSKLVTRNCPFTFGKGGRI